MISDPLKHVARAAARNGWTLKNQGNGVYSVTSQTYSARFYVTPPALPNGVMIVADWAPATLRTARDAEDFLRPFYGHQRLGVTRWSQNP